jgi:hypothetical protein
VLLRRTSRKFLRRPPIRPPVARYANFRSYPFGRGQWRTVAHVITGRAGGGEFRAFTYGFTGDGTKIARRGEIGNVVMIPCPAPPRVPLLSSGVTWERGNLIHFQRGHLNVKTIQPRVTTLRALTPRAVKTS